MKIEIFPYIQEKSAPWFRKSSFVIVGPPTCFSWCLGWDSNPHGGSLRTIFLPLPLSRPRYTCLWSGLCLYLMLYLTLRQSPSSLYTFRFIMSSKRYSNQDFIDAVASSLSIRQVLQKLGLRPTGGNYNSFRNKVKKLDLDTSHFKGKGWNKGCRLPKCTTEEYLSNKRPITSHKLRLRLIDEGYFSYQCTKCKRTTWNNLPIPLELEHIDGNPKNNSLNNLSILCPNCHAQTPTYRGKNKKRLSSALPD